MKKLILLFLTLFLICCTDDNEHKSRSGNTILLLRVDFTTYNFEGGHEQQISEVITGSDTIPISVNYKAPGDFGNISLYYQPTNTLLFDGSIIWMGTGKISYPKRFEPADSYARLVTPIEKPDDSRFQCLFGTPPADYSLIWNSISRLKIVSDYLKSHKKIGIFLYTPSVGIGNPKEWDWFLIMNKNY